MRTKINLQKSEFDIKIYRVRKKSHQQNKWGESKQAPLFIFMFFALWASLVAQLVLFCMQWGRPEFDPGWEECPGSE